VDGASELQILWNIIYLCYAPSPSAAVIILGHISLKIYDLVVAMTGPGIGFSTDVPAYFMWDTTFRGNHFSRGAAIAIVLLFLVAGLIVPYLVWSTRSRQNYDNGNSADSQRSATYVRSWQRFIIYLSLVLFAIAYLIPVYMLIITGMKTFAEVSLYSSVGTSRLDYISTASPRPGSQQASGIRGLGVNFMNSVYLTVPATILSALLGSINGYILSKWKFRGSDVLFPLMLFGMFIPYQSILIPMVQVLSKIPWLAAVYTVPFRA